VISRIEERNPELQLTESGFDLKALIGDSIKTFWEKWICERVNQDIVTPLIHRTEVVKKAIDSAVSPLHPYPPKVESMITKSSLQVESSTVQKISKQVGDVKVHQNNTRLHDQLETPTTSNWPGADLSYEKNDRLARRIFFDLRQDGANGTMSYLAAACVRHAFGVSWTTDHASSISFNE
jgi:hypothetical protein